MAAEDGRALIANYQELGYLHHDQLVILRPQQPPQLQQRPLLQGPVTTSSSDQPQVAEAIAFYQGASEIYRQGLNRWPAADGLLGQH